MNWTQFDCQLTWSLLSKQVWHNNEIGKFTWPFLKSRLGKLSRTQLNYKKFLQLCMQKNEWTTLTYGIRQSAWRIILRYWLFSNLKSRCIGAVKDSVARIFPKKLSFLTLAGYFQPSVICIHIMKKRKSHITT